MAFASHLSRWTFAVLTVGSLVSCNAWTALSQQDTFLASKPKVKVVAIADLADQLDRKQEVFIQGVVQQKAPFVGSGAYQVEDSTGTVWVLTTDSLPATGSDILLAGELNFHDLEIEQNNFGEIYLQEVEILDPDEVSVELTVKVSSQKAKTPNLETYFLPHKDNTKSFKE